MSVSMNLNSKEKPTDKAYLLLHRRNMKWDKLGGNITFVESITEKERILLHFGKNLLAENGENERYTIKTTFAQHGFGAMAALPRVD